jgi:hypothetical protein
VDNGYERQWSILYEKIGNSPNDFTTEGEAYGTQWTIVKNVSGQASLSIKLAIRRTILKTEVFT